MRKYLNFFLYLSFVVAAIGLYLHFGSAAYLGVYYNQQNKELRQNQNQLRPMYAELQRELVKSRVNMPFELDNLDLIIAFANIHSELGHGILPSEVKQLLEGVLRIVPQQVTVLNLLAIDAYKHQYFRLAVEYWQNILSLAEKSGQESKPIAILRAKIAETEQKIAKFESVQTKTVN